MYLGSYDGPLIFNTVLRYQPIAFWCSSQKKHDQVYPNIEISDGKDPGIEDDLPSVMLPCEQVRFDESLFGGNRYINTDL